MKFYIQAHPIITKTLKPKNRVPKQRSRIKLKANLNGAEHSCRPPRTYCLSIFSLFFMTNNFLKILLGGRGLAA